MYDNGLKIVKNNKFLLIVIAFFLIRLPFLTKLPIFNDEAIYLDWGFRETHVAGNLYYSLYDGKTPLLMWIFGIFETFITNPLFAGRLVSVLFGFLTLFGIYKITKGIWSKNTAIFASLIYVFTPIFVFFDRQALMESAVGATGIWSLYFLLKIQNDKSYKNSIFLGLVLGAGYMIKSSSIIFLFAALAIFVFNFIKEKEKSLIVKKTVLLIFSFLLVNFFLLINPQFWQTLSSNDRFVFTAPEIIKFPILAWIKNIYINLNISFFFLTPFVFITAIFGIYLSVFKYKKQAKITALFLLITLFLETFLTKSTSQRYLVSFLVPLVIFASIGIFYIYNKIQNNISKYIFISLVLAPSILLSLLNTINPQQYIESFSRITPYSQTEYISGQTSGYGVNEAIDYIKEKSAGKKTIAGIALNTGNPESGIQVYFQDDPMIKTAYADSRLFGESLIGIDCLSAGDYQFYFVSRTDEQAGLNKYFYKTAAFKNPNSSYYVGVYKIKENCTGKTFTMSFEK